MDKQIRGAVLDLLCHHYPKKLLILQPVNMHAVASSVSQCRNIMARFLKESDFRVIAIQGHGREDQLQADVQIVRRAVAELGIATVNNAKN